MGYSRRAVISGAAAILASQAHAKAGRAKHQLEKDVELYAGLGDKLTGSTGDLASARWLASRLEGAGLKVDHQSVTCLMRESHRVRMRGAAPMIGGLQFGSADTASGVWRGQITSSPTSGTFALIDRPVPLHAYWPEIFMQEILVAAQAGARLALVRPSPGQADAPLLYNRPSGSAMFPIPVVVVAPSDYSRLNDLRGESMELELPAAAKLVTSFNQIARTRGFDRASKRIVISTPRTGWFACGSERGAGIAALLDLAERASTQTEIGFCFVVTTGHEIGHLGMEKFLETEGLSPQRVTKWFHLGASIAARLNTYNPPFRGMQSVFIHPTLEPKTVAQFAQLGFDAFPLETGSTGEGGNIIRRGYANILALAGLHPHFHTPLDDGSAVDSALLQAVIDRIWQLAIAAD